MKDWATATFDCTVDAAAVVYGHRVFDYPTAEDALLLVPVHAYTSSDHFDDKGAQMITDGPEDFRVTSAYLDGRNPTDCTTGPRWHEGRLSINRHGEIEAWHQDRYRNWTKTGSTDVGREDHFAEIDVMTEIQYDDEMDLPRTFKGQILTQWRWIRDVDGGWHRPEDVLTLQEGSNNDGERARIDFAIDQDDGRFYFYHYIE